MTLEEAKKILEKEGFIVIKTDKLGSGAVSEVFTEYENPESCKAMQTVCCAVYKIRMFSRRFEERKARLKKELEEHSNAPMPGPGEEQPEDKSSSVPHAGLVYDQNFEVERLRQENKDLLKVVERMKEGNPALKEAASQFNDALLDEQAKKIEELTKEKTNLEDQITILNACKEYNENFGRKQIKRLGKEISKLNSIIHDKNAVLSDVAEELRLTKIREKNLAELGLKYVGENEKLKKELADRVVDKIDAQALKSAESALAYKEKVIADLGNELAATKKELEEKTKLVEAVRKGSKEYCEYGIAAEKMIQKMAKEIVNDSPVPSKDYKQYRLWANGYRFNPQLPDFSKEEEKKLNAAKMVDINAKCMRAARESINDIFESYAAKYAKSTLDNLKEKAYELFNAKAHNLGLVGSKDGNGIIYQMIGVDFAEEGGDKSTIIVECGKDIDDVFKEIKRLWQE